MLSFPSVLASVVFELASGSTGGGGVVSATIIVRYCLALNNAPFHTCTRGEQPPLCKDVGPNLRETPNAAAGEERRSDE